MRSNMPHAKARKSTWLTSSAFSSARSLLINSDTTFSWKNKAKAYQHGMSCGVRVTFLKNGCQCRVASRDSTVSLEPFDQTTFRLVPVFENVRSCQTLPLKSILRRPCCQITRMSHDNARVAMATQEFTPVRCHISLCKQTSHVPHAKLPSSC